MTQAEIAAHQHFWLRERGDCDRLTNDLASIDRSFLPEDFDQLGNDVEVDDTGLVQAAATEEETRYMLGLADWFPWMLGIVGRIDIESEHAVERLDEVCRHPKFCGIRLMQQDVERTDRILGFRRMAVLRELAGRGKTIDALVRPAHLGVISEVARLFPDLTIVVDRGAKPEIAFSLGSASKTSSVLK